MKLPEAYQRAASRYQGLAPFVGLIGTLWGIHIAFLRVRAGAVPQELWFPATDFVQVFGAAALAGFVVFLALLLIERTR